MLILMLVFTLVFCCICSEEGFDEYSGPHVLLGSLGATGVCGLIILCISTMFPGEKIQVDEIPLCMFREEEGLITESSENGVYLCYLKEDSSKYVFAIEENSETKFYSLTNSSYCTAYKCQTDQTPVVKVYESKRSLLRELCLFNLGAMQYEIYIPDTESKLPTYSFSKTDVSLFEER